MQALTQAGVARGSMPGRQAVLDTEIDAVGAEGAFLRHADALELGALDLVLHGRAIGVMRLLHQEARLIGARHLAIGAADADVVVDGDDAVGALARRRARADMHAGRIGAMLAADRHEDAGYVRITAGLEVEHLAPFHRRRGGVGVPAGRRAGLATDAAFQIRHHAPACHDCRLQPRDLDLDQVGGRAGGVGEIEQHGHQRIHAGEVEVLGERRRPVVELADDQQRVGADALAQHDAALGVVERRAHLDQIAVTDAELLRRRVVHHHIAVAGDVAGDLADDLDADIVAPGILHAARGDEPERIVGDLHLEMLGERVLPHAAQVAPVRQRLVFADLLVPPGDALLVQAPLELLADAQEPFLVGLLETQVLLHQLGIEVPHQLRERLDPEAVLAEPGEPVRLGAVGELGARRLAGGVPDGLDVVRLGHIEREVIRFALELHLMRAAVDRRVVGLQQAGAARELGADPGEVLRLALRRHRRIAQREALIFPELLDVFGAADAHELQTFEVGAVRQQHVGHVIGLVARIGEADDEREFRHGLAHRLGVPERDHRIGAIDQPDVGRVGMRQVIEILPLHHPGKMRRPERLAPRRIGDQRHQGAVGAARRRGRHPLLLAGGVHRVMHEAVDARLDAGPARIGRTVEPHGGAERAARHFEAPTRQAMSVRAQQHS